MKKIFLALMVAFAATACYDDSALLGKIDTLGGKVTSIDQRLKEVEEDLAELQINVNAMSEIADALQKGLYIKSVTPLSDGTGYTITFSDNKNIVIKNGADGKDGQNGKDGADGKDGKDGVTPQIVVSVMTVDGKLVWAVNGEPLKNGDKYVEVYATTPVFQINETTKKLEVSYDGGASWTEVGDVNITLEGAGENVIVSSIFSDVLVDEAAGTVTITVTEDGSKIVLPLAEVFELVIDRNVVVAADATVVEIPYTVKGETEKTVVDVLAELCKVTVEENVIKVTNFLLPAQFLAFADNGEGKTSIKKVVLSAESCSVEEVTDIVPAEGGQVTVNGVSNVAFDVVIPEEATWLTQVETKAGEFTLTFNVAENTTAETREAEVKLVRVGTESLLMSFTIAQAPGVKVVTIKDFAQEYVKLIDIWMQNVGVVNTTDGIGASGNDLDVENAHYVPDDTKFTVGGVEYNLADAVELASRSYLLLRGYDGNDTKTYGRNLPIAKLEKAYTVDDELPATHSYTWGKYPYAERTNGGAFKMVTSEGEFELMKVDILDDYSHRHTNYPGQGGALSNFCSYTGGYLPGYDGCCCVKRIMLAYAYFFKYMLDNNLQDATGISPDQTFEAPLFGENLTTEPAEFATLLWKKASGANSDPWWTGMIADGVANMDRNAATDGEYAYVAKAGAEVADIYAIEIANPANVKKVNMTGVEGGYFPTACVRTMYNPTTGKYVLIASAMGMNAGEIVAIYAWENGIDAAPTVLCNNWTIPSWAPRRFGDFFTVCGDWTKGELWFRSQSSCTVARYSIVNGVLQNPGSPDGFGNIASDVVAMGSLYRYSMTDAYGLVVTPEVAKYVGLNDGAEVALSLAEGLTYNKCYGFTPFVHKGKNYIAYTRMETAAKGKLVIIADNTANFKEALEANEVVYESYLHDTDITLSCWSGNTMASCSVCVLADKTIIVAQQQNVGISAFQLN